MQVNTGIPWTDRGLTNSGVSKDTVDVLVADQ